MLTYLLVCISFISLVESSVFINSFAGPFDVIFHKMEPCSPNNHYFAGFYPYRPIRDRKNKYLWWYNGTAYTTWDLGDELYGEAHIASWSSRGGWVDNAYVVRTDHMCSLAKQYIPREYVRNATAAAGLTEADFVCPFPKGNYTLRNFCVNTDASHIFPPLPYGKWRFQGLVSKTKRSPSEFCIYIYADTIPKPGGKSGKWPANFTFHFS